MASSSLVSDVREAHADPAIVHEYVPFDPSTDTELGAILVEGGFAAELSTRSGTISAPDVGRPIGPHTPMYGGNQRPTAPDTSFTPDRDVRRVERLPYDEPFRPRLAPFKRLSAFDAVEADYRLIVRDPSTRVLSAEPRPSAVEPTDPFYEEVALDLLAGVPARIPGVVAGAVIVRRHMVPPLGFALVQDGAENLFVVPESTGTVRLLLEWSAPRNAFGGPGGVWGWEDLQARLLPVLPANVKKSAEAGAAIIGVNRATMGVREALRELVAYFRDFVESDAPIPSTADIYLDLVRAKKGVCRHRAFGFMVTALGLGIPTRFVSNEAHAWVEVHDGTMWRRIDLGGAGRILDDRSERTEHPQPQYEPPADAYDWPATAMPGSDLVPPAPSGVPPTQGTGPGTGIGVGTPLPAAPTTTASSIPSSTLPPSKVTLAMPDVRSELYETPRGGTASVKGHVADASGSPCKQTRVEIVLRQSGGGTERVALVLATDDSGAFGGKLAIPTDLSLGDYTVLAHTPGSSSCGAGSSE